MYHSWQHQWEIVWSAPFYWLLFQKVDLICVSVEKSEKILRDSIHAAGLTLGGEVRMIMIVTSAPGISIHKLWIICRYMSGIHIDIIHCTQNATCWAINQNRGDGLMYWRRLGGVYHTAVCELNNVWQTGWYWWSLWLATDSLHFVTSGTRRGTSRYTCRLV